MRKIKTIDDITKDGKVEFGEGYEFVSTAEEADAILMRSTDLHGYELPEGIRAIARCGAGVNNIPVEEYAKKGVVVFNSPGANSNAVTMEDVRALATYMKDFEAQHSLSPRSN